MNQQITSRNTNKNRSHRTLAWWKRKEGVVLLYLIQNMGKDRKWLERKAWWERYTPKLLISIPFSCIKRLQWRRRCSEGARLPRFSLEDHHQNLRMPQALASRPWASASTGGVEMNVPIACCLIIARPKRLFLDTLHHQFLTRWLSLLPEVGCHLVMF